MRFSYAKNKHFSALSDIFYVLYFVDQKRENIDGIFHEMSKLHNHFSISPARKWTVTIYPILKEFPDREGVALER